MSDVEDKVAARGWKADAAVYLDRRMLVILLLGFSGGLPFALSFGTLSVWFAEAGVRKAEIGLFVLVGLPYSWKFLWAPFMDRVPVPWLTPWLGQRRSWALVAQLGLMGSLVWLGSLDPSSQLLTMAWAALLVVFMAASQDIAADAYRIEILSEEEQGAGGAMVQYGYRVGMITSGAGALYLSDYMSWAWVYVVEAALIVVGILTILFAPREPTARRDRAAEPSGKAAGAIGPKPGRWLAEALADPFRDFMARPFWLIILVFVFLYRLPDAFVGVMANVFYKEMGFSNSEIASVSKAFGLAATLLGIFFGGLLVHRYGVMRSLFVAGVVQMLSNLMYVLMAVRGDDLGVFALTIAVENVSGGMGGAAFVAYLSSLCSRGFAGTQYALLSAIGTSSRNTLSSLTGGLAELVDWSWFFVISTLVAVPGMLLLVWLLRSRRYSDELARSLNPQ